MTEVEHVRASEVGETSEALFEDLDDEGAPLMLMAAEGGERLDKWLAARLPEHSRSEIQRWIEAGRVTLAGRPLKVSYRVAPGDQLAVFAAEPENYAIEPEPIPLDVLYEDADLLVINKPAGMVVHPAAGNWRGTLVNAILYRCPDLEGVGGVRRPGIVHRLDKDTSGVILVAKNDRSHRSLQAQFKARTVQKRYLALVFGWLTPEQGEINAVIGRDPRHRQRMAVTSLGQGRLAVTRYEVIGYFTEHARSASRSLAGLGRFTLVACHPLTGRTHQIRVHLAHIKHPIVGDEVYGNRRSLGLNCPRQFLHAERIRFCLPVSGEEVTFAAPLPADLAAILSTLAPADVPVPLVNTTSQKAS